MKPIKLMSAVAASMVAGAFSTAFAADIYNTPSEPEVTYESPSEPPVNWSGPYAGVRLGYGHANHDMTLNEYFRDYCEGVQGHDDIPSYWYTPEVGFDDLDEHGYGSDVWKTVDNKISARPSTTGTSCETLARGERFGAGSHFTVPGDSRQIGNIDGISSHGVIGGLQIGIDQQIGHWVVGAFGSYDLSNMETNATFNDFPSGDSFSARIEKDDEWSLGLRAGRLLSERTLLYGLIAYTQTDYDFTASPDVEGLRNHVTFDGVSFGAGIEHALTNNVFIGIEGVHTVYQDETIFDSYDSDANHGVNVTDDLSETKVMGTLKVKLNGGY